jgi:DNA primase
MNFGKQRISLREIREMDMVNYLSSLGLEPTKIRNNDFWYLSPLREEKTSSFKINRRLNKWYDHGIGKGGNLIDFAVLYHGCTVGELFLRLNNDFSFHKPDFQYTNTTKKAEQKIKVIKDSILNSYALLKYLNQRQIPIEIARQYCSEVHYEMNGKTYFGIGFKNDSGAWEIRNPYFKSSSSPKDITIIKNEAEEVCVFEGFMDFLSFKTLHKNLPENSQDFVVLNSVSFFERARRFMENHRSIRLYLDRDVTGRNCIQRALSLSTKYQDESRLYKNHKDLNEWLVNFDNSPKKRLRQNLR